MDGSTLRNCADDAVSVATLKSSTEPYEKEGVFALETCVFALHTAGLVYDQEGALALERRLFAFITVLCFWEAPPH